MRYGDVFAQILLLIIILLLAVASGGGGGHCRRQLAFKTSKRQGVDLFAFSFVQLERQQRRLSALVCGYKLLYEDT